VLLLTSVRILLGYITYSLSANNVLVSNFFFFIINLKGFLIFFLIGFSREMAFNFNFNLSFNFLGVKFGLWYLDFLIAILYCYFFKCKNLNSQTCVIRKLANHVCM
jgi:hypothetical protein